MRFFKNTNEGYITCISTFIGEIEITKAEYDEILGLIRSKPKAETGFDYRLTADLTWELVELPETEEETTAYTAEQLNGMTNAELSAICSEMGISGSMTKANMIALILDKQNNIT